MRGVSITKPFEISLHGRDIPAPGPGEVRIRLMQGGLCGSDLSAYLGTSPMVTYPRVIGHEVVGKVIDAGPMAVEGLSADGDPGLWLGRIVTVEPYMHCGVCYACRVGRYNCCSSLKVMGVHIDGGLQEEFNAPVHKLHAVPEGMDPDAAVLAEPLTISTHAVERAGVTRGEKVLIFGAGAIGLLACQVVTSYIGAEAMVVDIRDDRLAKAKVLGASVTVNASGWQGPGTSPELLDAVKEWTGGEGVPVAIEASGSPSSNAAALDCLSQAGRISLVGWNKGPIQMDTVQLMRKEADVFGSRNSARTFPKSLEILAGGHVKVGEIVTHKLAMDEALAGLRIMQDPASGVVKAVLVCPW